MRLFGPDLPAPPGPRDPAGRGLVVALVVLVLGPACGPERKASEPGPEASGPQAPGDEREEAGVRAGGDEEMEIDVAVRRIDVGGAGVHVLTAGPDSTGAPGPQAARGGERGVLLLHGAAFGAHTWEELGTIASLARAGHRVVAVDLPGYGRSDPSDQPPEAFLLALLDGLGLERVVIVSPSMSGRYSLPFLERHPERVAGFVPVAPVGADTLRGPVDVPALVVWGEADPMFPPAGAAELAGRFTQAEVAILPGARHPAYLDCPERFHELLGAFVASRLGG